MESDMNHAVRLSGRDLVNWQNRQRNEGPGNLEVAGPRWFNKGYGRYR